MNSTLVNNFNHRWVCRAINEGTMKQIRLFDYYVLGKAVEPLFHFKSETPIMAAGFDAVAAYRQLKEVVKIGSVFLLGTRTAARTLLDLLVKHFGETLEDGFPISLVEETKGNLGKKSEAIVAAAKNFETVFDSESPRMAIFWVEKKGIYQTEDLIDHADTHLPDSVRNYLSSQTKTDLIAAGRCLAFNLPTATAFHVWRALEVTFSEYYVALSGKSFEKAKIARNWGAYIDALNKAGADPKITGNLDHIRAEYRNPVMHPTVNVQPEEAFVLVGIGFSAITQVLNEIARVMSPSNSP